MRTMKMNDNLNEQLHHPWCNYSCKPREGCRMCDKFYKSYPTNGKTSKQMMDEYFPDNKCLNPKSEEKQNE